METLPAVDWLKPNSIFTLTDAVAAFGVPTGERGNADGGPICELPSGAALIICGGGFSMRTVKVRYGDCYYCVFWRDLASALRSDESEILGEQVELLQLADMVDRPSGLSKMAMFGQALSGPGQANSQQTESRQSVSPNL